MDAFRSIDPMHMAMASEPRISTSNIGLLKKSTPEARLRGLNKLFYSMVLSSKTNDNLEIEMLKSVRSVKWYDIMLGSKNDHSDFS